MFANITVAVDGSEHGWRALAVACDLAKRYEAKIHIVHVPEVPQPTMAVGMMAVDIPVDMTQIMAAGQSILSEAVTLAREHDVEPGSQIVQTGIPSELIIHVAESTNSDLIVTGRRGMGSVASLLLGSTSQKVAHDAPCACLTVK